MTLAEAIGRYDELIRLGHSNAAVISLVKWLGANGDRPVFDQPSRIVHHLIARELADIARGTVEELDEIPGYWDFLIGETARHAGMHGTAQEYLGKAYQESRTADNLRWRDALENDYANLMIHIYSESGQRDEARRWLDTLFRNNLATGPRKALSLADALVTYAKQFGTAGIDSYTADVSARLTQGGHDPARVEFEEKAQYFLAAVDLSLACSDAKLMKHAERQIGDVLAGQVPPTFEAALRRARVNCLISLGRTVEVRAELERITFMQDQHTGSAAVFEFPFYPDLSEDSGISAVCAALDAGEFTLALDMIEQGRLRVLEKLRIRIDADTYVTSIDAGHPRKEPDCEPPGSQDDVHDYDEQSVQRGALMRIIQLYRRYTGETQKFSLPVEAWDKVFRKIDREDILEAARICGVLVYQIVHRNRLRMIVVTGDEVLSVGPVDLPTPVEAAGGIGDVVDAMGYAWSEGLATWSEAEDQAGRLMPVLIPVGERPELACLSEEILETESAGTGISLEHGLFQAPSVRFVGTRLLSPRPLEHPTNVLHIGDASNTLLGPWLEAAVLASMPSLDSARSLMNEQAHADEFRRAAAAASVIVASCHGAYSADELLGTSLGIGADGLSVGEMVASGSLGDIEMLFLASCEMGRRTEDRYEREAVSFSNAALVAGCSYVVAPVLPVNDLVSALIVTRFCANLRRLGPVGAYRYAMDKVRSLSDRDFAADVEGLWRTLKASEFATMMPWPVAAIEGIFQRQCDEAIRKQAWHSVTFFISCNAA